MPHTSDLEPLFRFRSGLPDPAPHFTGMPRYNFIGGHNDPTQIPCEELAEAAAAVLRREGPSLALYNLAHGPQGYRGLRDFVVQKLRQRRGIDCTIDDVLITSGSGPGIDLVNQCLVAPGDTVILEEFSYGGAITKLKRIGATIVGAPLDADGLRLDALASILEGLAAKGTVPKYIYTIPTIQNPTGSVMPLERRRQLLVLARRHGVPIFEDECYADLTWSSEASPALYALAPDQVVHVGSFSKTLSPAVRVGYAVAQWPVLSRLVACKTDSGTGALDQMVVAEYFRSHFAEHVARLTDVLGGKLATMLEALEACFGTAVEAWRPKGGIFVWLKLPDAVDVTKLLKPAAAAGIAFNAGPEWACDPGATRSHMRLCFALPSHEKIRAGVAALARVCYEETGIPAQIANVRQPARE
jgi:2-aminoadipate transaminase